ncbi:MAG: hypothetical protein HC942_02785, partial [Microcoleus sp. SU_5_6]|nr:hypothetical protein [Microcoleus sp. SU_5_6]
RRRGREGAVNCQLSTVNSSFCFQVLQNDCLRLRSIEVTLILAETARSLSLTAKRKRSDELRTS